MAPSVDTSHLVLDLLVALRLFIFLAIACILASWLLSNRRFFILTVVLDIAEPSSSDTLGCLIPLLTSTVGTDTTVLGYLLGKGSCPCLSPFIMLNIAGDHLGFLLDLINLIRDHLHSLFVMTEFTLVPAISQTGSYLQLATFIWGSLLIQDLDLFCFAL